MSAPFELEMNEQKSWVAQTRCPLEGEPWPRCPGHPIRYLTSYRYGPKQSARN